jgi:ectoine hydroxylase-related dioxygenase (phytanoyl-CoA dioxygenase family)
MKFTPHVLLGALLFANPARAWFTEGHQSVTIIAAGNLAFLVHFVGDIHQPLHAATNADHEGTCQQVNVMTPAEENFRYACDDTVVVVLEKQLGTNDPEATARKLEALYSAAGDLTTWEPGGIRAKSRNRQPQQRLALFSKAFEPTWKFWCQGRDLNPHVVAHGGF